MHREGAVVGLRKRRQQAQVDMSTGPRQCCGFFFFFNSLMSSVPIVETKKSQSNVSGVDRRETDVFFCRKNDVTVWDVVSLTWPGVHISLVLS